MVMHAKACVCVLMNAKTCVLDVTVASTGPSMPLMSVHACVVQIEARDAYARARAHTHTRTVNSAVASKTETTVVVCPLVALITSLPLTFRVCTVCTQVIADKNAFTTSDEPSHV